LTYLKAPYLVSFVCIQSVYSALLLVITTRDVDYAVLYFWGRANRVTTLESSSHGTVLRVQGIQVMVRTTEIDRVVSYHRRGIYSLVVR